MKIFYFLFILLFSFADSLRFFTNLKNRFNKIKKERLVTIYDANIIDKLKRFSDDKIVIIDKKNKIIYNNYTHFLSYNNELKLVT